MPLELKPEGIHRVHSSGRGDSSEAVSNFTFQLTASVKGAGDKRPGFLALFKRFPDEVEK